MPISGVAIIAGIYNAYVCMRDKKTQGTNGGTFTAGDWRTRDLTEELADTANIASLSSNAITLAAGTYCCFISCPAWKVTGNQARLYDNTHSTMLLAGTPEMAYNEANGYSRSIVVGRFTLTSTSELLIQHQGQVTCAIYGFGCAMNWTDEIYTVAEFWREAS